MGGKGGKGRKGRRANGQKRRNRRKGGKGLRKNENYSELMVTFWRVRDITIMQSSYHSFEDLWIWKEAMQICYEIYDCMKDCRDFKLRDQMCDSSVSMPSNIAEGFELNTNRAFIRHLYISKGSGGELRTQMYIAIRQRYVTEDRGKQLVSRIKRWAGAMQKFIEARKKSTLRNPT